MGSEGGDGKVPEGQSERVDVVLSVVLKAEGGIQVSGPGDGKMYDEPLCFWLLDKAKDFIKMRNAANSQSRVLVPHRGPFQRGAFGAS